MILRAKEEAVLRLVRSATAAQDALMTSPAWECPASLVPLIRRVQTGLAAEITAQSEIHNFVMELACELESLSETEVKPVWIDDECCLTAMEDRVVVTHRGSLLLAAANALQAYWQAVADIRDVTWAEQLLADLSD